MHSRCFWLNHQDGAHRTLETIPRGPRRIQREWPCSGAAPPLHVLRTCWIGDVHPTYSGEGPSRTNSQGLRTAATLSLFPPKSSGFDAPRSIFHASVESSIGPSSHELQSLLFSVNHLRVAARVSSPFPYRLRFRVHSDHTLLYEAGTSISHC